MTRSSGEVVTLRPAVTGDTALLLEWRNDADVVRFSMSGLTVTRDEHERWLKRVLRRGSSVHLWIVLRGGEPVGQVRIDVSGDTGVVSIALGPQHRGRGIGTNTLRAAVAEAAGIPRLCTLRALIHVDNAASARAFERAGFERSGAVERGFAEYVLALRPASRGSRYDRSLQAGTRPSWEAATETR